MATIDDIINGTFNSLGRDVPFVPATSSVSDMYAGIYAPRAVSSAQYPTPAQLSYMDAIPAGSYQAPRAQPLTIPGQPAGYSYPDTGNKGRATGAMTQQLAVAGSGIRPAWTMASTRAIPASPLEINIGTRGSPVMVPNSGPIGHGPIGRRRPGGTNFPVANPSPDLVTAYDDMVKGVPGALDRYGKLLADASGTGNIGTSSVPQRRGGLFGMLFGGNAGGSNRGLFGMVNAPRAPRAPNTYAPATSVSGNTGYRNERTGVLHTSDKGRQYGTSATGQRTDYGASPGQKTSGLKPGDRVYNSDTNSWELK